MKGRYSITQAEKDIAVVLIAIAAKRVTVSQLKKYLELKQRLVADVGAGNVPAKTLARMAAIESALKHIEREKAKYLN